MNYDLDWVCGIDMNSANGKIILIGIFLPYYNVDNVKFFTECVAKLNATVYDCDSSNI